MARWIILLRGVNVSGKNKVPMAEWKAGLAALGYTNIVTLQNSGNAVLDTNSDRAALIHEVTGLMRERFGLEIPVYAIEQESLRELLAQSPAWWGHEDKAIYDNLIFLLPPHTAEELEEALGAPHPELEWVHPCGDAVFWSFDRQKYQKTNWWPRTAQEPACPGMDHDTDSRYCAQAGSAVMAFPHKNDPCRAKPAGVLFLRWVFPFL